MLVIITFFLFSLVNYHLNSLLLYLRYGVEPPVLVKLEKEIELEETLLMTSEPPSPISTAKSCCHHGELHEAVRTTYIVIRALNQSLSLVVVCSGLVSVPCFSPCICEPP